MIWVQESLGSIALIFFSSVLYSLSTSTPIAYINAVINRLSALEKTALKFATKKDFQILRDFQDTFEKLHDLSWNQSIYGGGYQVLACTGVVFSHSAFTFYYIIKVFILEMEPRSPKLVISIIWWIFMFGNPFFICVTNEIVGTKIQSIRNIFRKMLTIEKDPKTIQSILITNRCISRELKFSSGLIDYNFKTIFLVRL